MADGAKYGLFSLSDHLVDPGGSRPVSESERLRTTADQAVLAEQAGFDSFGVGEHHFSGYIMPAPELLLAYAASQTSTIRLGTSVTLLANRDPVRTAEAFAVLDVLTGGRAEATFARGVSESTARAFGFEDFDEVRPRFDEYLRLVLRLLTEDEVDWSGTFRSPLEGVELKPRPIQQPHEALWIGGGLSRVSASLAAELGLPLLLPSLFLDPTDYIEVADHYRAECARHATTARIGFPSYLHVASSSQAAEARWKPYLDNYVDFALATRSSHGRPTDFASLIHGPAICGSPAQVVERILETKETLGLDRQLFQIDAGGMPFELVAEVIELLGTDVLPALRS